MTDIDLVSLVLAGSLTGWLLYAIVRFYAEEQTYLDFSEQIRTLASYVIQQDKPHEADPSTTSLYLSHYDQETAERLVEFTYKKTPKDSAERDVLKRWLDELRKISAI